MTFWKWSRVAANNATVDSTINWAEGQAPSSVNDSARAVMAAAAKFRDDITGAIVTGGTSTAYTVTSFQGYSAISDMAGSIIAFTPHTANGATVTLNVDGLGAKPLRLSTGVELQTNVLIAGTPYLALYNGGDAVWYLHSIGGNAYGIPLAAGMDYWGSTAPSSAFAFPAGQAISRTTYATLFSLISTTYGIGDGSTTFYLPDKTGRVSAMKESSATRLTSAISGVDGATLGAAGAAQNKTIAQANLPNVNFTVTDPGHTHNAPSMTGSQATGTGNTRVVYNGAGTDFTGTPLNWSLPTATTGISVASGGSGTALAVVQPTIICNYIMRII